MEKKVLVLTLFLAFLVLPLANAGFEREDIEPDLNIWDRIILSMRPLTSAGQDRDCQEYPSSSGIETGTKQISCSCGSEANNNLINFYFIDQNGGWNYLYEKTSPYTFNGQNYNEWAWECYCCYEDNPECYGSERECITETSYKQCFDGSWSSQVNCNSDEYCQNGYCITPNCQEQWSCSDWSICTAGNKKYRTCTDAANCGTEINKQLTVNSCTYPGGDEEINPEPNYTNMLLVAGGVILLLGGIYLWSRK